MAQTGLKATMHAASKKVLRFTVTDEDDGGNFDLSAAGLVPRFAMARFDQNGDPIPGAPLVEKAVGSGITLNPDALGNHVADVAIDTADTTNADVGTRFFEFDVKDGSNEVVVLASGTMTILPNVENTL